MVTRSSDIKLIETANYIMGDHRGKKKGRDDHLEGIVFQQ